MAIGDIFIEGTCQALIYLFNTSEVKLTKLSVSQKLNNQPSDVMNGGSQNL